MFSTRDILSKAWFPYLLLLFVFILVLLALLSRGLNLGYFGDVLAYEYHFQQEGIRGGMAWLTMEHWHRHLLGSLVPSVVHVLANGQSIGWYLSVLIINFATAISAFLFSDTFMRGKHRWLSFSVALLFVFDPLDPTASFEFPTNGIRGFSLLLSLVSMWATLHYVRGSRQNVHWYRLSFMTYIVALMSYEQAGVLFLTYPLIDYWENPSRQSQSKRSWLRQVASDMSMFVVILVTYILLLFIVFPGSNGITLSPSWIIHQIRDGIQYLLNPISVAQRIGPAWQTDNLLVAISSSTLLFIVLWWWKRRTNAVSEQASDTVNTNLANYRKLVILGLAIIFLNILSVAPTTWSIATALRLLYPGTIGTALLLVAGISWLTERYTPPMMRDILFSALVAFFVVSGVIRLLQSHQPYLEDSIMREKIFAAMKDVVPAWQGNLKPYILFVSDAHPSAELGLHGQDVEFPHMFDMLYDTSGIMADAVYFDVPLALAPESDVAGYDYRGPFIIVESNAIFSPLRPAEPIDPERLVIISYDHATDSASVLEELSGEMLSGANIILREDSHLATNFDLIRDNVKSD